MLLAVDVGNTNVVFALFEGREIRTRWRIATDPRRTGDEYAVWLSQLMAIEGIERGQVDAMIVSTVVPRARHNIEVLGQKYFGVTPTFAGEGGWPIEIDVDEPQSLGSDRAVNAVAAHAKYPGDLIVVDFGTATTFDVVDFNGAYKGGIIAPGINLSLDALVSNTEDQMLIGVYWGYVALMEGLIARLRAEIGRPAKVVATGGLAILFDEHTEIFDHVEPDLTLEGLAILAGAK